MAGRPAEVQNIPMTLQTEKLGGHMAVAVSGIDLARLDSPDAQTNLRRLLNDNLVLCVRGQKLAPPAFRDAMARFGTPMRRLQLAATSECDEVNIISSEDRDVLGDGKKLVNGASWHTDDSFMREPASLTMLYGVIVPSRGGDTQFANMYAAYDALSAPMKALVPGLTAIHDGGPNYTRTNRIIGEEGPKSYPHAEHPVIRTHPVTRKKALYVNRGFTRNLIGVPRDESDAILRYLYEHMENPLFQCRFRWQENSIAFWDNRCVQHRAMWDYWPHTRHGNRVTVAGDKPY